MDKIVEDKKVRLVEHKNRIRFQFSESVWGIRPYVRPSEAG